MIIIYSNDADAKEMFFAILSRWMQQFNRETKLKMLSLFVTQESIITWWDLFYSFEWWLTVSKEILCYKARRNPDEKGANGLLNGLIVNITR